MLKRMFLLASALAGLTGALELALEPPAHQWALPAARAELICRATASKLNEVKTCAWISPNGTTYTPVEGLTEEDGRVSGLAEPGKDRCGLVLHRVEDRDAGKWTCHVGVAVDGTLVTGSGSGRLDLVEVTQEVALTAG